MKCFKLESLIDAENLQVIIIKKPDAEPMTCEETHKSLALSFYIAGRTSPPD